MKRLFCLGALVSALALATSAQAGAVITTVHFEGYGMVTFAIPRESSDGIPPFAPVSPGDPVFVSGTIFLGDGTGPGAPPATPQGFTGTVLLSENAIGEHLQGFEFNVAGGATGANSFTEEIPELDAQVTLVNGYVTGVGIGADFDGEVALLSTNSFSHTFGEEQDGSTWGGVWTLEQVVPEPATWAIMLLGFGAVGGALRRRRQVCAAA